MLKRRGENLFHKLAGILTLVIILSMLGLAWRDIGFIRGKLLKGLAIGAVLFIITYGITYTAELLILNSRGTDAGLEFYASGFKMSGTTVRNAGIIFLLYTLFVNLINSWVEEGVLGASSSVCQLTGSVSTVPM